MKNFAMLKSEFNSVYLIRTGIAEKAPITHPFLGSKIDESNSFRGEIEALITKVLKRQVNCLRKNQ
jgi:hypothetical protein